MGKTVRWLVLAGAGWYVATQTNFLSYAGTILSLVRKETKKASPTPLEWARPRHEIDNLEGDISRMVRPIAEHLAAIGRLKKDLQATQEQLDMQREVLLIMARDLEGNPTSLTYGDKDYTPDQVKKKLTRDFDSFQRLEAQHHSQKKLLAAKETSLLATQEQLAKLVAKKREYEVRLAQLESEE